MRTRLRLHHPPAAHPAHPRSNSPRSPRLVQKVGLDQVAGPVGEALIMTAAGLFVAIPAVLAYNACARSNRLVTARLDGFAHSLHSYLIGGLRINPDLVSTDSADKKER